MTDALIKHLKAGGIPYTIKPDNDNQTQYLFIAYPELLKLAYAYPDIVIADCTYQTNKFNIPLLYIISMLYFNMLSDIFRVLQRFSVYPIRKSM